MVERSRIVQPFKSLEALYFNLNDLVPWPEVESLQESTEFVFRGLQADDGNKRLEKYSRDSRPKTLVCHDMMGGYLEDRFISGTDTHDAYLFYHWNYIDTFIYFSHHLITIPPYGWVNVAHKHGVKILGTVITEHKEGEDVWKEVLRTEESTKKFADALVNVAKFYKFEGWLLNVENEIKDVPRLTFFVKYLMESIHEEIEGSEVIWYDSVTTTGKLLWQNKLNESNENFFQCCDGIFLNYNWTDTGLTESYERAKKENRTRDVYVGLDVWGRRCPGGGGFNSAHALEIIRKMDLSVAIFAPAWTHEYFGSITFQQSENIFWAQLIPFLYIHIPLYDNEIFASSFCRGAGLREYQCGQISNQSSFFNLAKQNMQALLPFSHSKFERGTMIGESEKDKSPNKQEYVYETCKEVMIVRGKMITFETKATFLGTNNYVDYCNEFAYDGGGCLKFIINDIRVYHRLFLVQIDSYRVTEGNIIYRYDTNDFMSRRMNPILVLGNDSGNKIITANRTVELKSGWRQSTYFSDLKSFYEIGVAFTNPGTCYLGKIILEKRHLYFEDNNTCPSESSASNT